MCKRYCLRINVLSPFKRQRCRSSLSSSAVRQKKNLFIMQEGLFASCLLLLYGLTLYLVPLHLVFWFLFLFGSGVGEVIMEDGVFVGALWVLSTPRVPFGLMFTVWTSCMSIKACISVGNTWNCLFLTWPCLCSWSQGCWESHWKMQLCNSMIALKCSSSFTGNIASIASHCHRELGHC